MFETKIISKYHNNSQLSNFVIDKTKKLITRKYYWPLMKHNLKTFIKDCNICLALITVKH